MVPLPHFSSCRLLPPETLFTASIILEQSLWWCQESGSETSVYQLKWCEVEAHHVSVLHFDAGTSSHLTHTQTNEE